MNKALLIEVTVYEGDDTNQTNSVLSKHVFSYDGFYGYEVENLFCKLGDRFAKVIDEN